MSRYVVCFFLRLGGRTCHPPTHHHIVIVSHIILSSSCSPSPLLSSSSYPPHSLTDFCVKRLCHLTHMSAAQQRAILLTLSSSWVTIVFHTRTFSNTLESVLFAVAAVLVFDCMQRMERRKVGKEKNLKNNCFWCIFCSFFSSLILLFGVCPIFLLSLWLFSIVILPLFFAPLLPLLSFS